MALDSQVAEMLAQLLAPDPAARSAAARRLADTSPGAPEILPALRRRLQTEVEESVISDVVYAVAKLLDVATAAEELSSYLRSGNEAVSFAACDELARLGPEAAASLPALWRLIQSSNSAREVAAAATAIARIEIDIPKLVSQCKTAAIATQLNQVHGASVLLADLAEHGRITPEQLRDLIFDLLHQVDDPYSPSYFAEALLRVMRGDIIINMVLDDNEISERTKSRSLFSRALTQSVADMWLRRPKDILSLMLHGLSDDLPRNRSFAGEWIAARAMQIRSEDYDAVFMSTRECLTRYDDGYVIAKALGNDAIVKLFRDDQLSPHVKTRLLLVVSPELLDQEWRDNPQTTLQSVISGLKHANATVRQAAARAIEARSGTIPSASIETVLQGLEELLNTETDDVINSAAEAARIRLRQRERDLRSSPLLAVLRNENTVETEKIEAITELVKLNTRESYRGLIADLVIWIGLSKQPLVDAAVDALRTRPLAVQPLVEQMSRDIQPDPDLSLHLLRTALPPEHRDVLLRFLDTGGADEVGWRQLDEWVRSVEHESEACTLLVREAAERHWPRERLVRELVGVFVTLATTQTSLRVHQAVARLLMVMSDPSLYPADAATEYAEVREQLNRHAVPVLGRRLSIEENLDIRESIVQTLGNVGGREAIDALARAIAGDERIRAFRQELLSKYYLEPSKQRSDEAAAILNDAVSEARTTLRVLRYLNVVVVVVGIAFVVVGLGLSYRSDDATTRITGTLAGLGGFVGLIAQLIWAPMGRIQRAMGNLVQLETAFTSFIWELNLNGTYIQSQYVAEGILADNEIERTVNRIETAMNSTMNLVGVYTLESGQRVVTRINSIQPSVTSPGELVTVAGQFLEGDTSTKKSKVGMVAIDHIPVAVAELSWSGHEVRLRVPSTVLDAATSARTVWLSLLVDGMETNALPLHVVRGA